MKLSMMKAACKLNGRTILYTDPEAGRQWLSDGYGVWPIYGLRLFEEAIRSIWDISIDDWEKYRFTEARRDDKNNHYFAIIEDVKRFESELTLNPVSLNYQGYEIAQLIAADGGVVYVNTSNFDPVRWKSTIQDRYMLRTDRDHGLTVVAYYHDLICAGCSVLVSEQTVEELRTHIKDALAFAPIR